MAAIAKFDKWQNSQGVNRQTVLQTVQVSYNDVISATGGSFTDIPNLQVTITPTLVDSKFLIMPTFIVGGVYETYQLMFRAYRVVSAVETWIGASVTSGSRTQCSFVVGQQPYTNYNLVHTDWEYLDSPNTLSPITYKFKWADPRNANTHYIGASNYDADTNVVSRSTSTLTVMEIQQ